MIETNYITLPCVELHQRQGKETRGGRPGPSFSFLLPSGWKPTKGLEGRGLPTYVAHVEACEKRVHGICYVDTTENKPDDGQASDKEECARRATAAPGYQAAGLRLGYFPGY